MIARRLIASWLAGGLLLALHGSGFAQAETGASASPAEVERARGHFMRGVELYRDGDATAAALEFKRAYTTAPNYRLLYNLGQVSQELREYPTARDYFERYLKEGGSEIPAARRSEVEAALVKLASRIGALTIVTNREGAEIRVDDVLVGREPLAAAIEVSAGERRVSASVPGQPAITRVVDVVGGDELELRLEFTEPSEPSVDLRARSEPARSSLQIGPAVWFGIGTGALAAGAGIMAYLAGQDSADYADALKRETSRAELDSIADRTKAKALVSDILLVATVAGAGATLYFALSGDDDDDAEEPTLSLQAAPNRVALRARF